MALIESHLRRPLTLADPPAWQCGRCGSGPLLFDKRAFAFHDTADTANARGELWFEPEMIAERFAGFAKCPNPGCGEPVLVAGETRSELEPDPEQYDQVLVRYLHPDRVVPSPPLFALPSNCPDLVAREVRRAFDLYWVDPGATANAVRIAVEALMAHFRVRRYGLDKNRKRVPLPLHLRIDQHFRKRDPEAADTLLAIKWIGNAGSHAEPLTEYGVRDALDLLDHVLHELFVTRARRKQVRRISKSINKRKRPRPAKSPRK